MSNPLHARSGALPSRKVRKSVSGSDKDMQSKEEIWRFFSGDRLAYLVITVAVGIGITVFLLF